MTRSDVDSTKLSFDEVAISDFGPFQIAVLTTTQTVHRYLLSVSIPVTERVYHQRGYLICDRQIMACLSGLEISAIDSENSLFKPIQRLAPAVDLAFEVKINCPLPQSITAQSMFACQLPNCRLPYCTVFRQIQPRFVRIYPFEGIAALTAQAEQLHIEEALFVSQNRERLQQIPFYRASFGL